MKYRLLLLLFFICLYPLFAGTDAEAEYGAGSSGNHTAKTKAVSADLRTDGNKFDSIVVTGSKSYVPFEFLDNEGRPAGMFVDLWKLWSEKTGIHINYRCTDWNDAIEMVKNGKADVIGSLYHNTSREQFFDFSIPYYMASTHIFYHKNIHGINDYRDLSGFAIGVVNGDAAEDFLRSHIPENTEIITFRTYSDLVKAAAIGHLRVFACDGPVAIYYLKKFHRFTDFKTAPGALLVSKFRGAVSKGNHRLLKVINHGFKEISQKEITAIENKWVGSAIGEYFPWNYIAIPGGILIICFAAVLLWNRQLKKKVHKTTAAIKLSEKQYRELLENANEGILVIRDGRICFLNPKVLEISGRKYQDLLGHSFLEPVHPEDRQKVQRYYENLLENGTPPKLFEFRTQPPAGEERCLLCNGVRIVWKGRPAVLSFLTDITSLKKAEEENRKLQEHLNQTQKMEAIGSLAGGIAHDFNNILTSILGFSEVAMLHTQPGDPLYKNIKQIKTAATRASNLTKQLLLFSRKQAMQFSLLHINEAIENMLSMLKRLIGPNIIVHKDLAEDLHVVHADEGSIDQIIMNLITNARDAMPDGGTITINTCNCTIGPGHPDLPGHASPGEYVCLTVSDTGHGFSQEVRNHIFEPFFTTKEGGKGTGLGLAVVYGVVNQHRGWINVESTPGKGTVFQVYLPASKTEPEKDEQATDDRPDTLKGSGKNILLVEDEDGVREFTASVLREYGYNVYEASGFQEAVETFERQDGHFDLIFSDVVLPDHDGITLVDTLLSRTIEKTSPSVLLTSGYSDEKSQWNIIQERNLSFLFKPYNIEQLLEAVHTAITGGKSTPDCDGQPVN